MNEPLYVDQAIGSSVPQLISTLTKGSTVTQSILALGTLAVISAPAYVEEHNSRINATSTNSPATTICNVGDRATADSGILLTPAGIAAITALHVPNNQLVYLLSAEETRSYTLYKDGKA
jgi:hypothetical protein